MVGGISSLANVVVKEGTGRDIGGNMLALIERGLGGSNDQAPDLGMTLAAGKSDSDEPPEAEFGLAWRAAFAADFYNAEDYDPTKTLIEGSSSGGRRVSR